MKAHTLALVASVVAAGHGMCAGIDRRAVSALSASAAKPADGRTEPTCRSRDNKKAKLLVPSHSITVEGSSLYFQLDTYSQGAELERLEDGVQVKINGSILADHWVYNIDQVRFELPSWHLLDGERFPIEMRFMARSDVRDPAVVVFLVEIADEHDLVSEFLRSMFSNAQRDAASEWPMMTGSLYHAELQYHLSKSSVMRYYDSATTPRFAHRAMINVVTRPLYVRPGTYRALKSIYGPFCAPETPHQSAKSA